MTLKQHHAALAAYLQTTTLAILRKEDSIALGMKKRGFGVGKWNFSGGKAKPKETPRACVIRETKQEFRTVIRRPRLVAILYFYFEDVPVEKGWNQKCYVYEAEEWEGEPREGEEMAPRWWPRGEFPYHEMWPADRHWVEPALEGQTLTGFFLFCSNQTCLDYEIKLGEIIDE